ncbi:MAG: DHH family phosphoesterase [Candidatus Micrarchaeaceae archaeon]
MHRFKNTKELAEFLQTQRGKRVMLTFHSVGDTDAVSSAVALSEYFNEAKIVTPDIITSNANMILNRVGFESMKIPTEFYEKAELIILLDANNFEECGSLEKRISEFPGTIIIIDHHLQNQIDKENLFIFDDENYCATASIIYELLGLLGMQIGKKEAMLLLTGIIADSAELRNSTPMTFEQIGSLLKISKLNYYEIRKIMAKEESAEARAWAIKDLLGAEITISNGILFVSGRAHAHANLSADNAVRLGADISLFYSENENEISFSARLNTDLDKRYNIHLGKIMRELAPIIKGTGGGHPSAAGAYGPLKLAGEEFIRKFFSECQKKIENAKMN